MRGPDFPEGTDSDPIHQLEMAEGLVLVRDACDRLVRQQVERTAATGTGHIAQFLVVDHFDRTAAVWAMDVHETGSLGTDGCLAASFPHEPLSGMPLSVSREYQPFTHSQSIAPLCSGRVGSAPLYDSLGTNTRKRSVIDIDAPAVQGACAAIPYELLRSGSSEHRHPHPSINPAMLAELRLTPTWRRVLAAAARLDPEVPLNYSIKLLDGGVLR